MAGKLITLTTDFGHKDPFVGIMKGVILGIDPEANIIDLTHGIPPQDLMAGALALRYSVPFFPRGAIHVAVVDPGVGTERRPLLIEAEAGFFIGPDNGILSLALEGKEPRRIIELANPTYHLRPTSATFHGRDIFAPAAAYLSLGIPPEDFGPKIKDFAKLPWPRVVKEKGRVRGEIIYTDSFGNLVTNVEERDLSGLAPQKLTICLGSLTIRGLSSSYRGDQEGAYAALINSWGLLEIACFKESAARRSGAKIGDRVEIQGNQS